MPAAMQVVCYVAAVVCFIIAAVTSGPGDRGRWFAHWGWVGLAFWVAVPLVGALKAL